MCTSEQASTWKKQWFQFNKIEENTCSRTNKVLAGQKAMNTSQNLVRPWTWIFFHSFEFMAFLRAFRLFHSAVVSSLYFVNISFPFYWNEFIAFFQLNAWSSGGVYFLALRWIESRCFLSARSSFIGEYVFSSILLNWVHGFLSVRSFFVRISFVLCWMIKFMDFIN